jgi:ubiquinone/menaquinone biosynthesis C-methylase UbiE
MTGERAQRELRQGRNHGCVVLVEEDVAPLQFKEERFDCVTHRAELLPRDVLAKVGDVP